MFQTVSWLFLSNCIRAENVLRKRCLGAVFDWNLTGSSVNKLRFRHQTHRAGLRTRRSSLVSNILNQQPSTWPFKRVAEIPGDIGI